MIRFLLGQLREFCAKWAGAGMSDFEAVLINFTQEA